MPAGYILPPDTIVPQMGAHWISKGVGELRGNPFANSFPCAAKRRESSQQRRGGRRAAERTPFGVRWDA